MARFENVFEAQAELGRLLDAGNLTPDDVDALAADMRPLLNKEFANLHASMATAQANFQAALYTLNTIGANLDAAEAFARNLRKALANKPPPANMN